MAKIDFNALAAHLLAIADTLVSSWLQGGTRRGHEWVCGSLAGGKGSSFSVNLVNGKWAEFKPGGESGGDLVSLYAAIHELDMGEAARELAAQLGIEQLVGITPSGKAAPPRPPPPPPPESVKPQAEPEKWKTIIPVPPHALAPTFKHFHRKPEDITYTARYELDGYLMGYVVRFRTSDGGKDTLPYTWCESARDGTAKWNWRQWDQPRPLYVPGGKSPKVLQGDGLQPPTVIVVEGEKKADALHKLLEAHAPGVYLVVSWPGGSKAWGKALWSWIEGLHVLLWPDCDGLREDLTKAERAQYPDELARAAVAAQKPILPAHKQPGMAAMLGIGALIKVHQGCTVQILPIPAPGEVVSGWDCDDAINTDGWDFGRVLAFFGQAGPLPDDAQASARADKANGAGASVAGGGDGEPPEKNRDGLAEAGDGDDAFADHLRFMAKQADIEVYQLPVTRKLLIAALRKSPHLRHCLGFNELTDAPSTREPWPWRKEAGMLLDSDDLLFGDFVGTKYKLKAASRAALTEAVETVAEDMRFHPIRDWLESLEHDGKERVDKWLMHVLGVDVEEITVKRPKVRRYLEMVGRFVLMGLVARVMKPGCKYDYSLVLEGLTGRGKSTLIKALVGAEYFSDTHFDIGNGGKEGFEQFQGLWGYELSELTALRKADSEQVKQFFSSQVDRYRGAYGRYVQAHHRQVVIFCSTNKSQYLYDLTGNRRFWPVRVEQPLKVNWVLKWREQLFAEALALYKSGARYYPTLEEEEAYFVPEQRKRLVESAVQSKLYELLTREGATGADGKATREFSVLTKFVTLDGLVVALGADAAKSSSLLEGQIRGWLEAHGWEYKREGGGQRRRGYQQPTVWPPQIPDDESGAEPLPDEPPGAGDDRDDDVPF